MPRHELSLQTIANDLARGKYYGIFIDDTGGSGSKQFWSLPHDRITYVAVVLQPAACRAAISEYWHLLSASKAIYPGLTELHFVDVYNGNGRFKGVDWTARLSIVRDVVRIFQTYQPALIVQSLTPGELPRWQANLREMVPDWKGSRAWGFNMSKHQEMVLLILFGHVMQMLDEQPKHTFRPARVVVDQGFKKAGVLLRSPFFAPQFADGVVHFANSTNFFMLQLADFAAYVLNKTQQLLSVNPLGRVERSFLSVVQPIIPLYRGLTKGGVVMMDMNTGAWNPDSIWTGAPGEEHMHRLRATTADTKKPSTD